MVSHSKSRLPKNDLDQVWLKRHKLQFFHENIAFEVEKRLWFVIKYVNLKQTSLFFKYKKFPWNAAKSGYEYIFVCKQINMFIEWNSEDSIFIVNVDLQHILHSRQKRLSKTCFYCLFFRVYQFWRGGKKDDIYSSFGYNIRPNGFRDFFQKFCCQYTFNNSLLSPIGFHGYLGYYRSFIPLACSTWRLNWAVFHMRIH